VLVELVSIVAPVYVCVGLGFVWARLGRRYDTALITGLITDIGAPCLVFSSLVALDVDAERILTMVGATLLALTCFAVLGGGVLRFARVPLNSFLAPMVFPNTGNMGLPVCLFAFGPEGLALGACFFATTSLMHFTVGQWLWSGRASPGLLVRTPLAWSAALAGGVLWAHVEVPSWIVETTRIMGGFTIPLMQFTLGYSLARFTAGHARRSLALTALRLGMGVAVGVGLSRLLGLEGIARGVFILDCAMPVAIFNYMLAERYGRDPLDVAGVVMTSTLVSFVSLPLLLACLL